jgi:hypothetical protein
MKILRLFAAAALGLLGAIAAADPYLVVELNPGASPAAIATQYSVVLTDQTSDNSFAMYRANTQAQAESVRTAMGSNSAIAGVDIQSSPTMPPPGNRPKKGSTIPVVGDRGTLQAQNSSILGLINWRPSLANSSGREVRVAILDTGLTSNNSALWSKVIASKNFVEPGMLAIDRPMGTDSNGNGEADENVGHGTMVAGIVDFVAPSTKLIVARVADSDGVANAWNVVQGIRYAVEQGAEVINLSLASPYRNNTIARAVAYAERKNVLVVAGLGNSSDSEAYFPAKLSTVVGVAALDEDGKKADFSNWDTKTDAAAPGFSIVGQYWDGELVQWSGTSFASAFVSATIADCLRRRSPMEPSRIRRALEDTGVNINGANPHFRNKLGRLVDHVALNAELRSRN